MERSSVRCTVYRMRTASIGLGVLLAAALALGGYFVWRQHRDSFSRPEARIVTAHAETEGVPHGGDAADDPAIWVDPADPSRSVVIGTDKEGGIGVYDLAGRELQYLDDFGAENVDLRDDVPFSGRSITLVATTNTADDDVVLLEFERDSRTLNAIPGGRIGSPIRVGGLCLYRSATSGKLFVFVVGEDDQTFVVEQFEIFESARGSFSSRLVRTIPVGSESEGCVADDEIGALYVSEEAVGIWRYSAEPDGPGATERRLVDSTRSDGHLIGDVEGLAIARGLGGAGYLIASCQGANDFAVYRRGDNAFVGLFRVGAGDSIDEVTHTDGIEIARAALPAPFEHGLLVVQDDRDDRGNQNFKLVPWSAVASALALE